MVWANNCFQESPISPGAACILRGEAALSGQTGRIVLPHSGFQDVFDKDGVVPVILKSGTIIMAVDIKLVQLRVRPIHRDSENEM